jgi:hypothetical protein
MTRIILTEECDEVKNFSDEILAIVRGITT